MTKKYILTADDVVDNLTSTDTSVPLSANQGKVLNGKPDTLTGTSDPTSDQGKNGDLYVKYVDGTTKSVSALYNKIDGAWVKSSTGGSSESGGSDGIYVYTFDQLKAAMTSKVEYLKVYLGADIISTGGISKSLGTYSHRELILNGHNITASTTGYRFLSITGGDMVTIKGIGTISGFDYTSTTQYAQCGGAIYVVDSSLVIMDGVTITNCTSSDGGGIMCYADSSATSVYMQGGTITGCTASGRNKKGGGISAINNSGTSSITISGNATITGNYSTYSTTPTKADLGLPNSSTLYLGSGFIGDVKISGSPSAGGTVGTCVSGATNAGNIHDEDDTLKCSVDGTTLKWVTV